MRHEWIFDVLCDLRTYAQQNSLPGLAAKAEEALRVARAEIAALSPSDGDAEARKTAEGRSGHAN